MVAQKDVNCLSAVKGNGQPVSYVPAPCLGDICLPGDMLSVLPGNECFQRAMPSRQGCRVVPWQTAIQPQVPGVLTPITRVHTRQRIPRTTPEATGRPMVGSGKPKHHPSVCCRLGLWFLSATLKAVQRHPGKEEAGREGWSLQCPQVPAPLPATTTGHSENLWG